MSETLPWRWETNDAMKTCSFCGQPVARGRGSQSIGLCPTHLEIWKEDIAGGFKQNRLKEIMISRGEISKII